MIKSTKESSSNADNKVNSPSINSSSGTYNRMIGTNFSICWSLITTMNWNKTLTLKLRYKIHLDFEVNLLKSGFFQSIVTICHLTKETLMLLSSYFGVVM